MHALVVAPDAPGSLRLGPAAEPQTAPHQLVVDVQHISLNHGEVVFAGRLPAGTVHGYDDAGVVVRAATDGTGPPVGARVTALGAGALGPADGRGLHRGGRSSRPDRPR